MVGLKLIHISKRGHKGQCDNLQDVNKYVLIPTNPIFGLQSSYEKTSTNKIIWR